MLGISLANRSLSLANPWDQAENYQLVINWQDNSFGYSELSDSSSYPVIFQVV